MKNSVTVIKQIFTFFLLHSFLSPMTNHEDHKFPSHVVCFFKKHSFRGSGECRWRLWREAICVILLLTLHSSGDTDDFQANHPAVNCSWHMFGKHPRRFCPAFWSRNDLWAAPLVLWNSYAKYVYACCRCGHVMLGELPACAHDMGKELGLWQTSSPDTPSSLLPPRLSLAGPSSALLKAQSWLPWKCMFT